MSRLKYYMNTATANRGWINLAAAGLLAASIAHLLFSLGSIPGLMASQQPGFLGIAFAVIRVLWTMVAVLGATFVIYGAIAMLNARSYVKAKNAALGAMVLPLLGANGLLAALVLTPLGAGIWLLLRNEAVKASFGFRGIGEASDAA